MITLREHALAVLNDNHIEIYSGDTTTQVIYSRGSVKLVLPEIDHGVYIPTDIVMQAFANMAISDNGSTVNPNVRAFRTIAGVCIADITLTPGVNDMLGLTHYVTGIIEEECPDSDSFDTIVQRIAVEQKASEVWVVATIAACSLYRQHAYESRVNG